MDGITSIAAERRRQVEEEGWTTEHDDKHIRGELGAVAACYAVPRRFQGEAHRLYYPATWDEKWWKPDPSPDLDGRRRELVKAGAMIAAEIDRIDRMMNRGRA